jgi:ABC-2 type transport system ATP-binding protein
MIDVTGLTRKFSDFTAVDEVSFQIKGGEVVGLLGHNGAGKTTIMKMLTGFLEPTSGSISIDGRDVQKDRLAVQKLIGYLPENCPLYPEMTVIDYLDYQAALHGIPAGKTGAVIRQVIRRTELISKASQPINTLSRGYRQRVGVAQALLHQPKILILDEPTNGLDPTQIRHMRDLIREASQNATIIISTHILQEVQAVCDRAIIIDSGRKVVDERLDELQRGARLVVELHAEPVKARPVLESSDLVSGITEESVEGRWRYALTARDGAAPEVARLIHGAGFELYALYPERRDLETVFAEVSGSVPQEVRHAA